MWQYIAVYIIGILTVIYLCRKIYLNFFSTKKDSGKCGGCCGCKISKDCNENVSDFFGK